MPLPTPFQPPAEPGTTYPPLSVDELLVRAEACALSADALAAEYQVLREDHDLEPTHRGVLHLAALSRAYTDLAQARMRRELDNPPEPKREDPRVALRARAA